MVKSREEFFYFVLNHCQECVIRYNSQGVIAYCNDRLVELTGYGKEEIKGHYIGELFQNTFEETPEGIQLAPMYALRCFVIWI